MTELRHSPERPCLHLSDRLTTCKNGIFTQLAELLGYKAKLKRLAKREAALAEKEAAEAVGE